MLFFCFFAQQKLLNKVETFNVTENKTNSIKDILFLQYYLDLGLLR